MYDLDALKRTASASWRSIFIRAGIPGETLKTSHGPCPKCGGTDRFRMLSEADGSLICNQCFSSRNGDGIAALAWWWGTDFKETTARLAEHLGIEEIPGKKKGRQEKSDPEAKLEFFPWNDRLARLFLATLPGVSARALEVAGARMAYYYGHHTVIAIPVYGPKLLEAKPVGWIVQDFLGYPLPQFSPEGKVIGQVKRKLTYGSKPGVVGDQAARLLTDASTTTIWKVEGVSDYLAMETCLLAEPRPGQMALTLANGAEENWLRLPWLIEACQGKQLRIIHDCDEAGQTGAEAILAATAEGSVAKNFVLPWPIKKSHGEDLRDWLATGVINPVAALEAAFEKLPAAEATGSLYFGAEDDPHVLASRLLAEHFCHQGKRTLKYWREEWYHWQGRRYVSVPGKEFRGQVTRKLKDLADKAFAVRAAKSSEAREPFKVTRALVGNVIGALEGECLLPWEVEPGSLLAGGVWSKREYLGLENGILDIDALLAERDGFLIPHSPDWFSQVCLPYPYDADAECPRWEAFLRRNLEGDVQRIRLLQEWAGYLLTPDTSKGKFLILEGEGANGKSVFLAAIEAMLGSANVSHVALELFGQRFALTNTLGKLANIAADCGEIDKLAEGFLKSFTTGDAMSFDRKNISMIDAQPTARLMVATNNRPRFADKSQGLWRRMLIVPWQVQIQPHERIHGMDHRDWWERSGELSGVLKWAIYGLRRLRNQRDFTTSELCEQALNFYKLENNPARTFLLECYQADSMGFTSTAEIYEKYQNWCGRNGYKPFGRDTFCKEIKRAFPLSERIRKRVSMSANVWGYQGICEFIDNSQVGMEFN